MTYKQIPWWLGVNQTYIWRSTFQAEGRGGTKSEVKVCLAFWKTTKKLSWLKQSGKGTLVRNEGGAALANDVFLWSMIRPWYSLQPGKTSDCQVLLREKAPHCLGIHSPLSKRNGNYNFHKVLSCFTLTSQVGKGYDLEHQCYLKVDCYLQHEQYFLQTEGSQERAVSARIGTTDILFDITLM